MNIRFVGLVAGVCCLSVASVQAMKAEGTVVLSENGRVVADIVLPDAPLYAERFAAEELKYHLEKALGATVEVLAESNSVSSCRRGHIYLGHTRAAEKAGLLAKPLGLEERLLRTVGNDLYLLGNDSRIPQVHFNNFKKARSTGTLYAVYDFLENEMGVRWLWPGKTGEVIPKRTTVSLGRIDRRGVEPLEVRGYYFSGIKEPIGFAKAENAEKFVREQTKFLLRQRMGCRYEFYEGHVFTKWWEKYGKDHPEYFNLLPNGKRMPLRSPSIVTMCVSEPGVWRQKVAEWIAGWKAGAENHARYPHYPFVNCCENDSVGLCTCARCRAWDGPDPRFEASDYWSGRLNEVFEEKYINSKEKMALGLSVGGRWVLPRSPVDASKAASLADRYVRFYNEIAKLAKKECPEAKAMGYAYANYIEPPLKTRVGENTVIIFVPRSYFPYDQEESRVFREQWGGWNRMGAKRMVLRPNYMLAGGNHPLDTARLATDDFAFAYTNGMFVCLHDSLTSAPWSAQAMRFYATTRAMRDPLRGYDKARGDMLDGFGAAASAVNRYFDLVESNSRRWTFEQYRQIGMKNITNCDVGGSFRNPNAVLGDFFDESFFTDGYAALDEGVRLAKGDAEIVARIEFLRKGLRDTELGRRCRLAQKAGGASWDEGVKSAAFQAAFRELTDYRASVEGDCVCNYEKNALWERWFIGWPHKERPGAAKSKARKSTEGE